MIMGFAICSMHYTAMAAVSFSAMTEIPDRTNAMSIDTVANTAIIVVTFVVLGSVFLFQRMFPAQEPARSQA
jgi:NO-binding membrane sensor protein with MHYT domain